MTQPIALFALGSVLLAVAAALLVVGAARLDRRTGRGAFAVGVVAVAFGPCLAGLAFDLTAVLHDRPRLAFRTIIGSNIASVGLVLAVAALVRPVAAGAKLFATAIPLLLVATLLFWFLCRDNELSRVDGGILLAAGVGALVWLVREARQESDEAKAEFGGWVPERLPVSLAVVGAVAGLAGVVGGAVLTVASAVALTRVSPTAAPLLGLTVTAFAVLLPTLIAVLLAARKGRSNLILGLIVGPMLFNLLFIAGAVVLVAPLPVSDHAAVTELPMLALFALLLLPARLNGGYVPRWEGALLLAAYAGFVAWQVTAK